jgi:hypothetical protein
MRNRVFHILLALTVIAIPAIITSLLPYCIFNATLFDFIPGSVNDEIHYWHETLTFSQVGFRGGYYTLNELAAPFRFSHFGPHGPMFPMLYGTIGYFVGWYPYSAPIYNLVLVTIALCIFVCITKPDKKQLVAIGIFLATFWPLLLFLSTNMQEGLHFTIAIVLAGMFHSALLHDGKTSIVFKLAFLVILIFASLIRPSWSLLLVPLFVLNLKNKSGPKMLLAFVMAIVLSAGIFFIFNYLVAPYPNPVAFFFLKVLSFQSDAASFAKYVQTNLTKLVSFYGPNLHVLEVQQRYQLLFLLGVFSIVGGLALFKRGDREERKADITQTKWEVLFHFYNLGSILTATVLFYLFGNWGDYRVFAAHLLITMLLLIVSRQRFWLWLVGVIILSNVWRTPDFLDDFRGIRLPNFVYDQQSIAAFHKGVKYLVYDEDQDPWCNTLLSTAHNFYSYEFITVPAGIGISTVFDPTQLEFPLKSKYLLIRHDMVQDPRYQRFSDELNIERLSYTAFGDIYLNLDAKCKR